MTATQPQLFERQATRGDGGKVNDLDKLSQQMATLRARSKKIVLCHGVFDLLHVGHIRHFERAKRFGDVLVVSVTPDRYVNKGPGRPAFPEHLRAEAIAALDCVDYVAINRWPTAVETIQLLRPHIYAKGKEYSDVKNDVTGKITQEEQAVQAIGGQLLFTHDITFSSSALINKYLPVFPKEATTYLEGFSRRYSAGDIFRYLEAARTLKVLAIGETIIDEYQYCEAIGKSAKEPVLATRYVSTEQFAGGVLAIANHLADFCDQVGLLTLLGTEQPNESFVRQHLKPNVATTFLSKANSPTIIKRRFVEQYLLQKLFEVYVMNDDVINEVENRVLCAKLREVLPQYDVVIVADYGHGMLSDEAIKVLCERSRFLAVNTQSNAGNRGFNTISRYPRADYVCLAQHEVALEVKNPSMSPKEMIREVTRKLSCHHMVLTRGKYGSLGYSEREGFCEVPAFAHQVVDRMGAGDAVLSLTALCVVQEAPIDIIGFLGNVVGSQAVATLGHRTSIERVPLFKAVESLLK